MARPLPSRILRRVLSRRRCMVPALCERGPRPSLCGDVFTGSLSRVGDEGCFPAADSTSNPASGFAFSACKKTPAMLDKAESHAELRDSVRPAGQNNAGARGIVASAADLTVSAAMSE